MPISRRISFATAVCFLLIATGDRGWAAEQFVLVQNGERIATLAAIRKEKTVDIRWRADDNGRGSKFHEIIVEGADGLPDRWTIKGNAWFGAPVDERFERRARGSQWRSLNDRGSSNEPDAIYLPNESSPWALGLYLRQLLQSSSGRIRTAPAGELRLDRIREHRLKTASGERPIVLYALWGLDFTPTYLVAGAAGDYLGFIAPGYVFIESALEGEYAQLSELADTLDRDYLAQLTARLTNKFSEPYWIRNVRVFDSAAGTLGSATNVVVHGDKIVGMRTDPPPADAVSIDGAGGALLPGLHDMHSHNIAWSGPLHIAAGVTSVRDMGNDNAALHALVGRIENGTSIGPHISRRGFLEGRSPFSARGGFVVDQLDAALQKVRWYADRSYAGIKVYNSMTPSWVKPIADEAHRLGLKVSGHVPAFMAPRQAVLDGYDEINHINQLMLGFVLAANEDTRTTLRFTAFGERVGAIDLDGTAVRDMIELMRARGIALDPTMQLTGNMLMGRPGTATPGDLPWLAHMPAPFQRARRVMALDIKPAQYPAYEASWKKTQALLLRLHRAGVRIIPGTDDMPGLSLHSELESYVAAGLTPSEALQSATLISAQQLNSSESGSVAVGKRADLILIDGDPTQDIRALRRVRMTIKSGIVYYPEEIHRAMGIRPFAAKPELSKGTR